PAAQFLALAQKQSDVPRMMGHRLMGTSTLHTGEIAQARTHYDQALKLHDPSKLGRWRADLAKTCERRSSRIVHCPCGYLAIPMPQWVIQRPQSGMRAKSGKPLL